MPQPPLSSPSSAPLVERDAGNDWSRFIDVALDARALEHSTSDLSTAIQFELRSEEVEVPRHGSVRVGLVDAEVTFDLSDLETCMRRFPALHHMEDRAVDAVVVENGDDGPLLNATVDVSAIAYAAHGLPADAPLVSLGWKGGEKRPKEAYRKTYEGIKADRRVRPDGRQFVVSFRIPAEHKGGKSAYLDGACEVSCLLSRVGEKPEVFASAPPAQRPKYKVLEEGVHSVAWGRGAMFRLIFGRALEAELERIGTLSPSRWRLYRD